ncbi:MAG: heme-copper oxidase subunit III [Phycisphaerae bacterium]|nr:heme-copper oxidase subunit III [Phycisphaerae bacterium]|tara:strand:+ start:333 stop:971 length:639 start_codon:yes stop_codon:yes gene_type:complete
MSQVAAKSLNDATQTEAPVAPRKNLNRGKLGMACLICSEITFFGTLLATYVYYIGRDLSGPFPQDVLDVSVAPMKVVFNSIFLLTSSIWIVLAVKALRKGRIKTFAFWWFLTILFGAEFLVGTGMEWYGLIVDDGLTIRTNLFGSGFYTVVGFHAGHVCCGLIILTIVFVLTLCGYMHKRHAHKVDMLSWYWHFVDGIWIAVFTIVYILGNN